MGKKKHALSHIIAAVFCVYVPAGLQLPTHNLQTPQPLPLKYMLFFCRA